MKLNKYGTLFAKYYACERVFVLPAVGPSFRPAWSGCFSPEYKLGVTLKLFMISTICVDVFVFTTHPTNHAGFRSACCYAASTAKEDGSKGSKEERCGSEKEGHQQGTGWSK